MNYFERFELKLTYEIDLDILEQKYFAYQQQYHPDKFTNRNEGDRIKALQDIIEINQAYEVLKSDLRRAEYLLKLANIDYAQDESTIHDPEILAEAFEDRDALELIESEDDLNAMIIKIKSRLEMCKSEFSKAYELGDFSTAAKITMEMKYKNKLLDDMLAN